MKNLNLVPGALALTTIIGIAGSGCAGEQRNSFSTDPSVQQAHSVEDADAKGKEGQTSLISDELQKAVREKCALVDKKSIRNQDPKNAHVLANEAELCRAYVDSGLQAHVRTNANYEIAGRCS